LGGAQMLGVGVYCPSTTAYNLFRGWTMRGLERRTLSLNQEDFSRR